MEFIIKKYIKDLYHLEYYFNIFRGKIIFKIPIKRFLKYAFKIHF